tara:strand:+ start:133 stop:597 length:465 start_codon:yes stop_codon:yes gene_type:complete
MEIEEKALIAEVDEFLSHLLEKAALDLYFVLGVKDRKIDVRLHGEDMGLILSDNARLLYAISHLLNRAFYRRSEGAYNFTVDCDGYLSARTMELELMACQAAEKARTLSGAVSLQAMPASERRVVHLAIAEEPGVKTESEGSGLYRRVIILPGE